MEQVHLNSWKVFVFIIYYQGIQIGQMWLEEKNYFNLRSSSEFQNMNKISNFQLNYFFFYSE